MSVKQLGSRPGPNVLSFLNLDQTVCKGYQQMTKVSASKEKVKHVNTALSLTFGLNHYLNLYG